MLTMARNSAQPNHAPDLFLTPEQVAAECGVTKQTVLKWIRSGRLGSLHLSRREIRVPRPALDYFTGRVRTAIPPELLAPRLWQEMLADYERYFGLSTAEMLALHAAGTTPELRTGEDESLYDWWLDSAREAVADGRLAPPAHAAARPADPANAPADRVPVG